MKPLQLRWLMPALILTLFALPGRVAAQFSLDAQLRTRAELRDGQGAPLPQQSAPAFFISQRTRLNAGYNREKIKIGVSVQDVRVWGQDVSTINRTTTEANNGLMLHEAWAEIGLSDTASKSQFAIKVGRQELIYDDQRVIGNLDWLQQARRHDAVLLKFNRLAHTIHAGFAFNQNRENAAGTVYNAAAPWYAANTNGGSMYKSFEFIHYDTKHKQGTVSLLFFADQFSKYHTDQQNAAKVWDRGSWTRITAGTHLTYKFSKTDLTASAYYQTGKNADGKNLSATLFSISALQTVTTKFSAGPGFDYTSGGVSATESNAFDPLYGTPHKFWGYMDYFYAGSGFGNRGLINYYLKSRYKAGKSVLLALDLHHFSSASAVKNAAREKVARKFGKEIDFVATHTVSKVFSVEAGYSHFFSSPALTGPGVKNISNPGNNSNWAYLMLNIRPALIFIK
ncbi:MAG: alginate export family protein [Gemmatimonadaceae bacterium]|nr:alginate export family protein [Chitinophagaceae bacterium]